MNSVSTRTEPDIESDLLDLDAIPFTTLRNLDGAALRHSLRHVVERTRGVHARYRSSASGGGERID